MTARGRQIRVVPAGFAGVATTLGNAMTLEEVSQLVEMLPGVVRQRQDGAVDFQVGRTIFASITIDRLVVLKLNLEQQEMVLSGDPEGFAPVKGAWGERGWTEMNFKDLDEASVHSSLMLAWTNVTPKRNDLIENPADIWRL